MERQIPIPRTVRELANAEFIGKYRGRNLYDDAGLVHRTVIEEREQWTTKSRIFFRIQVCSGEVVARSVAWNNVSDFGTVAEATCFGCLSG